jgi:carbon-monoxide dehydrogenase small subunit
MSNDSSADINTATISFTVNGKPFSADAEPRTHLGDFLREEARLTGTHLGCEHGVCGACTVLIDGAPARSCITYAVACEGKSVTTVEGYDDDPVMQRLRDAFTRHHALQCGYCTPGMLATARDIVLRLPKADEARIRVELAGNLCRCTGYQGIVGAITDVLAQLNADADPAIQALRKQFATGSVAATVAAAPMSTFEAVTTNEQVAAPAPSRQPSSTGPGKQSEIDGEFDIPFSAEKVWAFMGDLPAVASCLPGASIDSHENDRVKGKIAIKFGPMSAAFAGGARLERDDANRSAVLRGAGQDSLSQSRANGDVSYQVKALGEDKSRVNINLAYALQGPLAQFSRSGLVKDFVQRMIADFARNVEQRLGGNTDALSNQATSVNPVSMMLGIAKARIMKIIRGD